MMFVEGLRRFCWGKEGERLDIALNLKYVIVIFCRGVKSVIA